MYRFISLGNLHLVLARFLPFCFEKIPQSRPVRVGNCDRHHLAAGSYTRNDKLLAQIVAETADAIEKLVHLFIVLDPAALHLGRK